MTFSAAPPSDPFLLYDTANNWTATFGYRQTAGLINRSFTIDPALKTEILIGSGQSNGSNVNPTLFVPTHSSVIDNLNLYDGGLWSVGGPLLGCTYNPVIAALGPGNILARIAELRVATGKADRVIVAPTGVGSTFAADWGDGIHSNRVAVAMARLAARGIAPATPGISDVIEIIMLGESDCAVGTSQASYAANSNIHIANSFAAGVKHIIIPQESYTGGNTSAAVRAAQASLWPRYRLTPQRQADAVQPRRFRGSGASGPRQARCGMGADRSRARLQ